MANSWRANPVKTISMQNKAVPSAAASAVQLRLRSLPAFAADSSQELSENNHNSLVTNFI